MKKLRFAALTVVLLLAVILAVTVAAQEQGPQVRLTGYAFSPSSGQSPNTPPGLTISGYAQNQQGYYIVQFGGPVEQSWKDAVGATGAEFLGYVPDFAFKVRMNPAQAAQVENLADVAWVGLYQPAYKLSTDLIVNGSGLYRVRIERGANTGQARAAVVQSGAQVLTQDGNYLLVAANGGQLEAIANVLDVAWVENHLFHMRHNEEGAGVIMGANTANALGYDGSTQIVAVTDTGIGDGTPSGAHVDIPASRVTGIFNWTIGNAGGCYRVRGDGAQDVDSGHGTHVAVSVLGDGGPGGIGQGTAPAANLIFQAVEDYLDIYGICTDPTTPDGYYLIGLPDDLHDLYQQAYDNGARIHTNSWGSDVFGVYTLDSVNTDDFIWDNPDMTITFSAGNEGIDVNADGVVDNDSIGSPATAKNVVTVGASEGERPDNFPCDTNLGYTSNDLYQPGETCNSMGGLNILGTAGFRWGFSAEPLFSDVTAGNNQQMAPFSSRGPVDDGRIKPDVVAPGTWILSGYSSLYQEGYGDPVNPETGLYQWDGYGMPYSEDYKYMGGTSMSTPLVAGGAAVIRDFYEKAFSHSASAALVKATLINSAVDLLDENNDGSNDNDYPIPNVHEGWGRVNLANATDGSHQYVENTAGIGTNGNATYPFTVDAAGSAFKVTLVWSDYPSTEAASTNLVNDLDLTITAPNGTTVYRGNVFSGGWSQTGGSYDRINNVENVYVQNAAAGNWTVEVDGFNVPNGPQPFAIVVDGDFGTLDATPTVNIVSPTGTISGNVTVQIDANDVEDPAGSLTVEYNIDGGAWQAAAYNGVSGYYEANWDTNTASDGGHTVNARATDSAMNIGSDNNSVTVANGPTVNIVNPTGTVSGIVTVEIDATDLDDPAGTLTVEYNIDGGAWQPTTYNGVSGYYEASWDTTTVSDGAHTINARATDSDTNVGNDSQGVTVNNAPSVNMHVGDIDASTSLSNGGKWNATITITIHDDSENPVADATVNGSWSNGANGGGSCTTDGSGQCSFTKNNIHRNSSSATYTITSVTHASNTYTSGANHDPDGDSDGTSITVQKPQ